MKKIIAIALVVGLSGCIQQPIGSDASLANADSIGTMGNGVLYAYIDEPAGNMCYALQHGNNISLSCVPARYER